MLSQSTKATMYTCIQLHVPQTPLSFFSNKKHTFDSCITSDAAPCNLCMHSSKSKIKVENQTIKKNYMTIQYRSPQAFKRVSTCPTHMKKFTTS